MLEVAVYNLRDIGQKDEKHYDNVAERVGTINAVDPFQDGMLPNVSSGLGLADRRMVKPDLYFPGGREFSRLQGTSGGLTVHTANAGVDTNDGIRHGIAVTIEAGTALPIYSEIQERLRISPRPDLAVSASQ